MTNIRRYYLEGCIYFITNVTFDRIPILIEDIDLLWASINKVTDDTNCELIAWVILPEHFHFLFKPDKKNISRTMQSIKMSFLKKYQYRLNLNIRRTWQYRFWDRMIRDADDFDRHLHYIHYNPVKHGLVESPFDYPHSSIFKFKYLYDEDWGRKLDFEGDFGE